MANEVAQSLENAAAAMMKNMNNNNTKSRCISELDCFRSKNGLYYGRSFFPKSMAVLLFALAHKIPL